MVRYEPVRLFFWCEPFHTALYCQVVRLFELHRCRLMIFHPLRHGGGKPATPTRCVIMGHGINQCSCSCSPGSCFLCGYGTVTWIDEEVHKLIKLLGNDTVQARLEGCHRNTQVYERISSDTPGLVLAMKEVYSSVEIRSKKKLKA